MSAGDIAGILKEYGLPVLVVILLITGILVPKWVHDDVKKQRDEWKEAARLSDARADALAEMAHVARDFMSSANRELTSRGHDPGGASSP